MPTEPPHLPNARVGVLDGWRGVSILCVLAAHMLPLGPAALRVNEAVGAAGMALFFTLSGYLITALLLRDPRPGPFLVRRGCRILPLAVGYMVIGLVLTGADTGAWVANLTFTLNYQEEYIRAWNSPLWSLCVEVHFYAFVAALVAFTGRRGLWALPAIGVAVTAGRVASGETASIHTLERVDEILAGGTLALVVSTPRCTEAARALGRLSPWLAVCLLLLSASPLCGPLQYVRPYAAAALVGATLLGSRGLLARGLHSRPLAQVAAVSFALYVIHPCVYRGWMDEGSTATRYLIKRPISVVILFCLAHASSLLWEAPWIALGKRLTGPRPVPVPPNTRSLPCATSL